MTKVKSIHKYSLIVGLKQLKLSMCFVGNNNEDLKSF